MELIYGQGCGNEISLNYMDEVDRSKLHQTINKARTMCFILVKYIIHVKYLIIGKTDRYALKHEYDSHWLYKRGTTQDLKQWSYIRTTVSMPAFYLPNS